MPALLKLSHDFIAFDFETANAQPSSICQIGLAMVQNGAVVDTRSIMVNPQTDFDPMNISIHGIGPRDVANAPVFSDVIAEIHTTFSRNIAVSHSAFDKNAINGACKIAKVECPLNEWIDSMRVVRRAWPDLFGKSGYGLKNVAKHFGIEFGHHDASEDARAAALIMLKAIEESGIGIADWVNESKISASQKFYSKRIAAEGNPAGELNGHIAVFTGEISMSRQQAAETAAKVGVSVRNGVTKKTTLLIVGTQNPELLAGHEKSSKHRKAEEYIAKGQDITILSEIEFLRMIES